VIRFMITLDDTQGEALIVKAQRERRDPRDQAELYVEYGLRRDGLLPTEPPATATPAQTTQPGAKRGA
jgi:hypothetical protein